jgi:hypothetical protein
LDDMEGGAGQGSVDASSPPAAGLLHAENSSTSDGIMPTAHHMTRSGKLRETYTHTHTLSLSLCLPLPPHTRADTETDRQREREREREIQREREREGERKETNVSANQQVWAYIQMQQTRS